MLVSRVCVAFAASLATRLQSNALSTVRHAFFGLVSVCMLTRARGTDGVAFNRLHVRVMDAYACARVCVMYLSTHMCVRLRALQRHTPSSPPTQLYQGSTWLLSGVESDSFYTTTAFLQTFALLLGTVSSSSAKELASKGFEYSSTARAAAVAELSPAWPLKPGYIKADGPHLVYADNTRYAQLRRMYAIPALNNLLLFLKPHAKHLVIEILEWNGGQHDGLKWLVYHLGWRVW